MNTSRPTGEFLIIDDPLNTFRRPTPGALTSFNDMFKSRMRTYKGKVIVIQSNVTIHDSLASYLPE